MRAGRGPSAVLILLVFGGSLMLTGAAGAGSSAGGRPVLAKAAPRLSRAAKPGESLEAKKEALGEVRRQIEEARERASAAKQREISLLGELERIDRTLGGKRAEIRALDHRIARVEAELLALDGRRGRVAEDTVTQQAALSARLTTLARLAAAPPPPSLFAGMGESARRRAVTDLALVARQDLGRLERFDETAGELAVRQAAMARAGRELVGLRAQVATEREAMAREGERRRALLAKARDDRATHERMAGELSEAARRLEALVRDLSRRSLAKKAIARPSALPPSRGPAVGLGRLRGQLPWPAEGRIVSGFGQQIHPRFGTETSRNGVDIDAPDGAPIRAVAAGTVLYRGRLKGYGTLIVLDHGEGYYTLYGHAAEALVDEGEVVRAGATIGRVGETGSADGPRLYFEVRYQGRAEDPHLWLRRRS